MSYYLKRLYSQFFNGAQGAGFHRRNRNEDDVDDEVDIEGDDQAVYGEVQFTEGDVLPVAVEREDREDVEVNIEDDEGDETQQTLRELVAASDVGKSNSERQRRMDEHTSMSWLEEIESVIASARQKGSKVLLAAALENKIKFLVKICTVFLPVKEAHRYNRNQHEPHLPLHFSVGYVLIHIPNQPFRLAAGILAAENAG